MPKFQNCRKRDWNPGESGILPLSYHAPQSHYIAWHTHWIRYRNVDLRRRLLSRSSVPGSLAVIVFAVHHRSADVAHQAHKRNRHDKREDGHHVETEAERRESEGKGGERRIMGKRGN